MLTIPQLLQTRALAALEGTISGTLGVFPTSVRFGPAWGNQDLASNPDGIWCPALPSTHLCAILDQALQSVIGSTVDLHLEQAQDATGTGVKPLAFGDYYSRNTSIAFDLPWTLHTHASSGDLTGLDGLAKTVLIPFAASDLDVAGGFTHFRLTANGGTFTGAVYGGAMYLGDNPGSAPSGGALTVGDCDIGLYVNNLDLNPITALADVVEPNFTGYSRKSVGTAWNNGTRASGNRYLSSPSVNWIASAFPSGANTVRGAFIVNRVNGELNDIWPFANPLSIDHVGQIVEVSPEFGFYGSAEQELIPSTS